MTEWLDKIIGIGLAGIVGLMAWIVRNVFTNQSEIKLMKESLMSNEREVAKLSAAVEKINDTQSMIAPLLSHQTKLLEKLIDKP